MTDTGLGMDRETLKHLFEPFFTTKGVGKGSGLGLAMVYGIVKQSGGYIWPYSEPAQGTTFKIYLPSVADPFGARRSGCRTVVTSKGATVLVVEDDPLVRTIAKRSLREAGFEVLDAADGNEALQTLAQHRQVDLVLTDLAMPELGGRELARRLSRVGPTCRSSSCQGIPTTIWPAGACWRRAFSSSKSHFHLKRWSGWFRMCSLERTRTALPQLLGCPSAALPPPARNFRSSPLLPAKKSVLGHRNPRAGAHTSRAKLVFSTLHEMRVKHANRAREPDFDFRL